MKLLASFAVAELVVLVGIFLQLWSLYGSTIELLQQSAERQINLVEMTFLKKPWELQFLCTSKETWHGSGARVVLCGTELFLFYLFFGNSRTGDSQMPTVIDYLKGKGGLPEVLSLLKDEAINNKLVRNRGAMNDDYTLVRRHLPRLEKSIFSQNRELS